MSHALRFRFSAVLLVLLLTHSTLLGQIFRHQQPRRVERPPVERQDDDRRPAVPVLAPADAKSALQQLAGEIKANPRKISENDLIRCQRLLLNAVNDLGRRLPREFNRAAASDWSTTLQLNELRATLRQQSPDEAVLEAVQAALDSDKEGARWVVFDGLRTALRRYQTVARLLQAEDYEKRLTDMCDNLVNYIDTYTEGRNPLAFVTITEAVMWLDAVSLVEPRTARLADLTRAATAGVNLKLQAGSHLAVAGFKGKLHEILDINETILGTKVVGSGTVTGETYAELVPSPYRAAIKVLADALLETHTVGSQRMVTLKNHTTGPLRGEKQILFSSNAVTTTPARAKANLEAQISDVKIDAGPVIKKIARGQIDSRKEDSLAEAARRAERRMSEQMNERIDTDIAKLNETYQKIRDLLNKTGLFPRVWNLSSTTRQINWAILLGNNYQPSAPVPAPASPASNGLTVQVHQSALNNMLAAALAGRTLDEERFAQRIGEFFDEIPEFLQRQSDETPANISFVPRAPVDVLFADNKIRVVVRLDGIQVMDNATRSFTISVEYQVKTENGKVIMEQTEAEAFPTGFRPGSGTTLSATQTVIRSYLLRRLEALPKRYEAEPLELGGEWKGKGKLMPQFIAAEKGWLSFGWTWE